MSNNFHWLKSCSQYEQRQGDTGCGMEDIFGILILIETCHVIRFISFIIVIVMLSVEVEKSRR